MHGPLKTLRIRGDYRRRLLGCGSSPALTKDLVLHIELA